THIAVATVDGNYGAVSAWNSATDVFSGQNFEGIFWSDLAISPDGSKIAAIWTNGVGITANFVDEQLHFLSTTAYPDLGQPDSEESEGASYTSSGNTLVVPSQDCIEF